MPHRNVIVALIFSCACAAWSGEPDLPQQPLTPRNDLPGLKNFAQVSSVLYRGEQPTAEGFAELKKLGVKTVVCLRAFHDDTDLLKGSGLQYARINCKAWHPEEEDVAAFMKLVREPKNQPVFVHCQHGSDRTGMMVASYRILEQHWSHENAIAETKNFDFHEIWADIKKYLGAFDSERVNKLIEKTEVPKIEVVK